MLDLGSRPWSDVAQQTCSQLRPLSSRCLTSCGFSLNPASTAFQSNALTSGSMEVLDTIFVGLYTTAASPAPTIPRGVSAEAARLSAAPVTPDQSPCGEKSAHQERTYRRLPGLSWD